METKLKDTVAIILAAGVSKRMNTGTPKVLQEVCGRPMLAYVLEACRAFGIGKIFVVIGFGADKVRQKFLNAADVIWVYQKEQKGTAHAVLCCREHLKDFAGRTFVLCGDGPLVRPQILAELAANHNDQTAATLATAMLDDPTGYGRIIRNRDGSLLGIIEHKECTAEQLKINEVNPSYYLFDNRTLFDSLDKVKNNNVQGEFYLTDVFEIMIKAGRKVSVVAAVRPEEAMSVNTKAELEILDRIICQRLKDNIEYRMKKDGANVF